MSNDAAAWVEAVGAIAAVVGAGWVAAREARATGRREERAVAAAKLREERLDLSARSAALNLAILAAAQIHDLHMLLRNDAWRGRILKLSASRSLLLTERMLAAFPIQSLGEARAMVEFSRFPGSIAIAAEIYANLETAIRASPGPGRALLFEASQTQMKHLDGDVRRQLTALRLALNLPAEAVVAILSPTAPGQSDRTAT